MGILSFLGSLTFTVIVFGLVFIVLDVLVEVAPPQVAGTVTSVTSGLSVIRPTIGLEHAGILLIVLVVGGFVRLIFHRRATA